MRCTSLGSQLFFLSETSIVRMFLNLEKMSLVFYKSVLIKKVK